MDFPKKQTALFYINKEKGMLYVRGKETPFEINFPKTVVHNMEVVNKTALEQLITKLITDNQLKPMTLHIVLSRDITFEKELENIPLSLLSVETEKFLEMVPIHHVLSKTYTFSNKTTIVAVDRNFCNDMLNAFSENQFIVLGMIPLSIFQEKLPTLKDVFDGRMALEKIESLKQYFLPVGSEQQERLLTYEVPSLKNTQFVVLISIFALLLIILGVQVYTQISPKPSIKSPIIKRISPTPVASPSATLVPSPTSTEE